MPPFLDLLSTRILEEIWRRPYSKKTQMLTRFSITPTSIIVVVKTVMCELITALLPFIFDMQTFIFKNCTGTCDSKYHLENTKSLVEWEREYCESISKQHQVQQYFPHRLQKRYFGRIRGTLTNATNSISVFFYEHDGVISSNTRGLRIVGPVHTQRFKEYLEEWLWTSKPINQQIQLDQSYFSPMLQKQLTSKSLTRIMRIAANEWTCEIVAFKRPTILMTEPSLGIHQCYFC